MVIKELETALFLDACKNKILIDVRSPSEYKKGHIPGSLNIPLFDDEERKIVGTLYKKSGKKDAVLKGLEFVQPKLRSIVDHVFKLMENREHKDVYVYCWRGGARSESITWLLTASGIDTTRLESGYKAYRNQVLDSFKKDYRFIVLGGKTGCGKTDILKEMKNLGEQVIDLEGIACHKGSAFGDLGQPKQPTPQQFENNLFKELNKVDLAKKVWLENESPGIGNLYIPVGLRETKGISPLLTIDLPQNEREKRITREYGSFEDGLIIERIKKIEKKLGRENCKAASEFIESGDLNQAVSILLKYYDKAYTYSDKKKRPSNRSVVNLKLEKDNPLENAKIILEYYSE